MNYFNDINGSKKYVSMRIFTLQKIMRKILPQKKKKDAHEDL